MRSSILTLVTLPALALAACDTATAPSSDHTSGEGTPLTGPVAADFSPGGATLVTTSASDSWPELEGDHVAWYRAAPADQEGVWLLDLRTGEASRIWAGTVLSAFDMVDHEIFWGSADGLHSYDIDTRSLVTLASGFRQYRDVSAGPRYIIGTATQSSARPFVFDRAAGTESLIATPTAVPATRGWGDYVLWTDHRESLQFRDFYLYHIPTATETAVTDQSQFLSSGNADIHGDRVVYFARRFCPGPLEQYQRSTGAITPVALPPEMTCPVVVELEGDILVYRHAASGGIIHLGFVELVTGEQASVPLANPGNWRIDADLDGTRVVHTSAAGLVVMDLRFQPPQPPVAEAGGPYHVEEGALLTLDGSGSMSLNGAPLRYRWEMGDGSVLEGTPTPTHAWVDDGTYPVLLSVWEEDGPGAEDGTTVTVENRPPLVSVEGGELTALAGSFPGLATEAGTPVTLSATFTDPGLLDAPWRWSVAWEAGELASGTLDTQGAIPLVTWTPDAPGTHTVTVRVEDKDGGVAQVEIPLTVSESEPEYPALRIQVGSGRWNRIPAPAGNGVFPAVVFGMEALAVTEMDWDRFRLGEGEAAPLRDAGHTPVVADVDGDGLLDLRLHFRARDAGLQVGVTEACLTGAALDGAPLLGCGVVQVAGSGQG
ncbi:MAG TPA: PKD domain-containing protein [Longimicrobiales bacterium]|nr:PKD domain-containing protein [Longimicrobiales bacterium]